jgi:hypothetical protein
LRVTERQQSGIEIDFKLRSIQAGVRYMLGNYRNTEGVAGSHGRRPIHDQINRAGDSRGEDKGYTRIGLVKRNCASAAGDINFIVLRVKRWRKKVLPRCMGISPSR